jgi:hypothetical protein
MGAGRSRWHHYVPRFHLRLFSADPQDRFIYRHDKRTDRTEYKAIRSVAARIDYYTIRGPDGEPVDAVESPGDRRHPHGVAAAVVRRARTSSG